MQVIVTCIKICYSASLLIIGTLACARWFLIAPYNLGDQTETMVKKFSTDYSPTYLSQIAIEILKLSYNCLTHSNKSSTNHVFKVAHTLLFFLLHLWV